MLKKLAWSLVGGLSDPGKMPCHSYGLPARIACPVGRKLSLIKGSVCWYCYACTRNYMWPSVREAQARRFAATKSSEWVEAMVTLISGMDFFRWHDSGDLYSDEYYKKILIVAHESSKTYFWLPSKEAGRVRRFAKEVPKNLTVRVSAPMLDQYRPMEGFATASVHKEGAPIGKRCSAKDNGGICGPCRDCWDKSIPNVSYPFH